MPLPFPNLDDRDYDQLRAEALEVIRKNLDTDWSDLSPGDPGIVLLEAFIFLTEQMIFRLNQLPDKVYIAFLRMLGVTIDPPKAADVRLKVWQRGPGNETIHLPFGSRVTTSENGADGSSERPVFTTSQNVIISPDDNSEDKAVYVSAYACEWIEESLGKSKGTAGQIYAVRRPPIIDRLPYEARLLELIVGVEIDPQDNPQAGDRKGSDGKFYHTWKEVEDFSDCTAKSKACIVDRQAGLIQFAPASQAAVGKESHKQCIQPLAAVPAKEREIRVWYPRGGGSAGNVKERQLTALEYVPSQAGLPALEVTNPKPARGGLDAGTLEDALVHGPQQVFAQRRAVTAHEFESIVLGKGKGAVVRARALTQASLWEHGIPGTVDIVLVPEFNFNQAFDQKKRGELKSPIDHLFDCQEGVNLDKLEEQLKERSPMGIQTRLRWARYKQVEVRAQITSHGNETEDRVSDHIISLVNHLLSPFPVVQKVKSENGADFPSGTAHSAGRPFGKQLRVTDVFNSVLLDNEKGQQITITSLDLKLEHAPNKNVACLAADDHQPGTWYAGSGQKLFRSTNNGSGWELILHLQKGSRDRVIRRLGQLVYKMDDLATNLTGDSSKGIESGAKLDWGLEQVNWDETVQHVCPSPDRPGLVALSSINEALQSSLYLSLDCGENWYQLAMLQENGGRLNLGTIEDMAWFMRRDRPILLLATAGGLLEVNLDFSEDGSLRDVDFFLVPVLEKHSTHPVNTLTVVRPRRGGHLVVAALKGRHGLLYTTTGDSLGYKSEFDKLRIIGQDLYRGEDIRHLNVQYLGNRIYLWAAAMAVDDQGQGCYRWEFDQTGRLIDPGMWISQNWSGGSCLAVAFDEIQVDQNRTVAAVYAATAKGGLMRAMIDKSRPDQVPTWDRFPFPDLLRRNIQMKGSRTKDVLIQTLKEALLGIRAEDQSLKQTILDAIAEASTSNLDRIEPLTALDARFGKVMVACKAGIYRREHWDENFDCESYENCSRDTFSSHADAITIPDDWLLFPGCHQIDVTIETSEDDASRHPKAEQGQSGGLENTRLAAPMEEG